MAPTSSRRVIPSEPPEAVNRITKHKTTVSKSSSSSKFSRMLAFTTEALRKAEVLEKTLGSQIPTEDIIESMEIQIESTAGKTPNPLVGIKHISRTSTTLSNILDGKLIEKSSVRTSYRISNVPRKIGTLRDNFEHHLVPVTTADVTMAITAAAGTQPIS
ncbi:hypothetical protein EPUL_006292, partial [Erysiphe pulchra]